MEEELGWSRTVFFGALSARFLLAGMLGPVFGPLSDEVRAPRYLMPIGVLLLGGSLSAIRWVDSPLLFFALYGIVGAVASAILHLTMWEAITLKWFSRKRTRALVIGGIGEGSGPLFFPLLITVFIAWFGWRDAWLWYGVLTTIILMPIALAMRTRPEHVGQMLDGATLPESLTANADGHQSPLDAIQPTIHEGESFTRSEALHTQGFWMLLLIFTLSGVVITGFQSQWIPHFRDIGISATLAATAVSVYGLLNITSRILWGILVPRFPIRILMVAHALAASSGVAFLVFVVNGPITLLLWAVYQGLMLGVFFSLHTMISAEYFGRSHIGAIRGAMLPSASLSRAGGPLLLSALRDAQGSYASAFVLVFGGWGLMAALTFFSRKPNHLRVSKEQFEQ